MLKTRLIPLLFIKNGLIVRSERFSYHQNVGNVVNQTMRYSEWDVDELIYLDITREGGYDLGRDDHKIEPRSDIVGLLKQIADVCFMPLTFGGGIRTLDDMRERINHGADKLAINTLLHVDPSIVEQGVRLFGAQCFVASIDYRMVNKTPMVFVAHGREKTGASLVEWTRRAEAVGVGEILLNDIDRDGMANGYNIDVVREAMAATTLPTIVAGGAGGPEDFVELAEQTDVSGVAAGNLFHFTENSYLHAKQYMYDHNIQVRV